MNFEACVFQNERITKKSNNNSSYIRREKSSFRCEGMSWYGAYLIIYKMKIFINNGMREREKFAIHNKSAVKVSYRMKLIRWIMSKFKRKKKQMTKINWNYFFTL